MKTLTLLLVSSSVIAFGSSVAVAEEYPTKRIEIVIPFEAGSNSDTAGRILFAKMQELLPGTIVPLNVPGAGGTIGVAQMAAAEPDGYTLAFTASAPTTIQPHLRQLPYGQESLEPVCMVANNPTAVTVVPDSPFTSMEELLEAARSERLVSTGAAPGSVPHITQAAIANAAGVEFTYLPAGGGANAARAVLSGEAHFATDNSAMGTINGLRTLAVASEDRLAQMPDIPTLQELDLDVTMSIFVALYAPQGTPEVILDQLSDVCVRAANETDVKTRLEGSDYIVTPLGREEFIDFYNDQHDNAQELLSVIPM